MLSNAQSKARRSRLGHYFLQNLGTILAVFIFALVFLVYFVLFVLQQNRLPGSFELTSNVNTAIPLVFAAVGQGLVVITRGIDLSIGGIIDLSNVIAAVTIKGSLPAALGWSFVILLIGGFCGLINGLFVAVGRLQPIVVTLATLSIFQGIAIRILPQPGGSIPSSYTNLLTNQGHSWALVYIVVLSLLWSAFRRSRAGVNLLAIGNDEHSAKSLKINTVRTKIMAYVLAGILSSASGLFLVASSTAGDATMGNSYTLTSIIAAVIGGVSLFGGRGSAIGAIIGVFIVTLIGDILFFGHVNQLYESFYGGIFLVIAVLLGVSVSYVVRRRR